MRGLCGKYGEKRVTRHGEALLYRMIGVCNWSFVGDAMFLMKIGICAGYWDKAGCSVERTVMYMPRRCDSVWLLVRESMLRLDRVSDGHI